MQKVKRTGFFGFLVKRQELRAGDNARDGLLTILKGLPERKGISPPHTHTHLSRGPRVPSKSQTVGPAHLLLLIVTLTLLGLALRSQRLKRMKAAKVE